MAKRILIVEARFYDDIADKLLAGAMEAFDKAGVSCEKLSVAGALEIPGAISMARKIGLYEGFLALGCVIRGETYHFEIVCNESARGLMDLSVHYNVVLANGILTCETKAQAEERADQGHKNKGKAFAEALLNMLEHQDKFRNKRNERSGR